jgi:DNA polymerase-3 subunit gamma/tau
MAAGGARAALASAQAIPLPAAAPPLADAAPSLESFADLVALATAKRELKLKHALEHFVRVIRFEPGQIEVALTPEADPRFAGELSAKLEEWSGRRWMVAVGGEPARPTIAEEKRAAQARLMSDARADPVVAAVLARFPGAEIVDVRVRGKEPETVAAALAEPLPASELDDGEWELEP